MTNRSGLTYKDAGVDIAQADALVRRIGPLAAATRRPGVLDSIGGFGGLFGLREAGFEDPVLVSGTDGVGTKLKLAFATGIHDTVGIDLVAMCVNDILCAGAEPLFFLDYFGTGRLQPQVAEAVIAGIAEGCRRSGCALIGGETAELPGMYADGEYDLAGFAVGAVERSHIISRDAAQAGDVLVGLASSGLHSNGFSLARRALLEVRGLSLDQPIAGLDAPSLGAGLLTPTRLYVQPVLATLRAHRAAIHGMAHITGGGLVDNVPRCLPEGLTPAITYGTWDEPTLFGLIREAGVEEPEMRRTFNLGIGFVLVVALADAEAVIATLREAGEDARRIGTVAAAPE